MTILGKLESSENGYSASKSRRLNDPEHNNPQDDKPNS
jgi:hypothetical protein